MREITKLENTSLSDFRPHAEECLEKAGILPWIVCAVKRHEGKYGGDGK